VYQNTLFFYDQFLIQTVIEWMIDPCNVNVCMCASVCESYILLSLT